MDRREYHRNYYQRNKEKIKKQSEEWYKNNREAALHLGRERSAKRTPEQIESDKERYRRWYRENRANQLAKAKEEYRRNPEPKRKNARVYRKLLPNDLRKTYNRNSLLGVFHTTQAWYESKLREQENHCALCERVREENGNRLGIDHDHHCCKKYGSCGKCLRGILCRRCNVLVGNLEVLLSLGLAIGQCYGWVGKALEYIRKYRGEP